CHAAHPRVLQSAGAGPRRILGVADVNDRSKRAAFSLQETSPEASELLPELVAHLHENRTQLREEWARRITDARLLTAMTPEEVFSEATSVYDNYVEVL